MTLSTYIGTKFGLFHLSSSSSYHLIYGGWGRGLFKVVVVVGANPHKPSANCIVLTKGQVHWEWGVLESVVKGVLAGWLACWLAWWLAQQALIIRFHSSPSHPFPSPPPLLHLFASMLTYYVRAMYFMKLA